MLNKAIKFATEKHSKQFRKGTVIPYIVHPLETMTILLSMRADMNLLVAGVLHDTIEDTDTTYEEILSVFGEEVAKLVNSHSEDKSKTWDERKSNAINVLKTASTRHKMLVLADKVANLRSMYTDYIEFGDSFYSKFKAPKEKQAWYYNGIKDALDEMEENIYTQHVYREMKDLIQRIF